MPHILRRLFALHSSNLLIQLVRYTFVGGLAFVVDYGLLLLLANGLGLHYIAAATISFIAGLTVNYLLSTRWVFGQSVVKDKRLEFLLYATVGVIGLAFNNLFLWIFSGLCGMSLVWSKPLTAVLVYAWNFLARRFFLFKS